MRFLISIIIISLYATSWSQTNNGKDEASSAGIAVQAKFKGGTIAMQNYLIKNTKYPPLALENNVQGEVMVSFIISKQGNVESVSVVSKKIGFGLEEEAIRVIKSTNNMWIPATQKGKNVAMRFQIPIRFHIEPERSKKKKRKNK